MANGPFKQRLSAMRQAFIDKLKLKKEHFRDFTGTYAFRKQGDEIEPTELKWTFRQKRKMSDRSKENLRPGRKPKGH